MGDTGSGRPLVLVYIGHTGPYIRSGGVGHVAVVLYDPGHGMAKQTARAYLLGLGVLLW